MNESSSMLLVSSGSVIEPEATTSRGENKSPPTELQPKKKTGFYKRCTKFEKRLIAKNYCEMRGIEGLSKTQKIKLMKKLMNEGHFPAKWVELTEEQMDAANELSTTTQVVRPTSNDSMVPGGNAESKHQASGSISSSVKLDFKEGSPLPSMSEQPLPGVRVSKWRNKTFLKKYISSLRREGVFPRSLLEVKGDESSLLPGESGKTRRSNEGCYTLREKRNLARKFCAKNGMLYSNRVKFLDKRIRRLESTGYFQKMFTKMKKLKLSYDRLSSTENVQMEPNSKITVSNEPCGTTESNFTQSIKSSGACLDDVTPNPGCDSLGDPKVSDSEASTKAVISDPLEQEKPFDCQNYDSNLQRPERPSVGWRSREQLTDGHSSLETKMSKKLKNTFGSKDHSPRSFNHPNDWSIYSTGPERSETPGKSSGSCRSNQLEGIKSNRGNHNENSAFQRDDFKKPNPQHFRRHGNASGPYWPRQSEDYKARGSQYGSSTFQRDDFQFKKPNPHHTRRPENNSRYDWSSQSEDNKARGSQYGSSTFQRDDFQFKKPNPQQDRRPGNDSRSDWSSQSEDNNARGSQCGSSTFQRDDFQFKKPNPHHARRPENNSRSDWSSQSEDNKARGSQYGSSTFHRDDFQFKKPNPQHGRRPGDDSRSDWPSQSEDNKARGSQYGNSAFQRDDFHFKKPNPQHGRRPGNDSRSDWPSQSEDNKARSSQYGNSTFQRDDFQFKKPNPHHSTRPGNDSRSDWSSQSVDNQGSHYEISTFSGYEFSSKKRNYQCTRMPGNASSGAISPSTAYSGKEQTFTRPPSITPGPSQTYQSDNWEAGEDDQFGNRVFLSDSHVFPLSKYNTAFAVRKPAVNERYRLRYSNDSQQVDNEHKRKSEEPERRPCFDSKSGTITESRKNDSFSRRPDPPLQNRWGDTAADDGSFSWDTIPSVKHRLGRMPENNFSSTTSPKRPNMRRYHRSTENRSVNYEETCYMAVVPRDYPEQGLAPREMAMIRNALLELSAPNLGLRFDGTFEDRGAVFFGCKDQFTVDWLWKTVQNLKPWRGAHLKLLPQ